MTARPVTLADLARNGKLLAVHCSACRPERHLYIEAGSLGLPKRMTVPEVVDHLVCSRCLWPFLNVLCLLGERESGRKWLTYVPLPLPGYRSLIPL
jgi:hypothetical protein